MWRSRSEGDEGVGWVRDRKGRKEWDSPHPVF